MGGLLMAGALLLTSCSLFGESETVESEGVWARTEGASLVVENQRMEPVWIRVYGASTLINVLLAPNTLDGEPIRPGEQRVVSFEDLRLSENEEAVTIFWWEAVEVEGEREAGPWTAFQVEL